MIKTFTKNKNGKDFIVGDIHGCYDELLDELSKLNFDFSTDRLFSVGDLADRGPKNIDSIKLMFEKWFYPVIGNHEQLMYDAHRRANIYAQRDFLHNGGEMLPDSIKEKILKKIEELPYIIEIDLGTKKIGILHAEIPTYCNDWNEVKEKVLNGDYFKNHLLWGRDRIVNVYKNKHDKNIIKNIDEIYVGHTIVKKPITSGNINYIDCGACLKYWLNKDRYDKVIKKGYDPKLIIKELS